MSTCKQMPGDSISPNPTFTVHINSCLLYTGTHVQYRYIKHSKHPNFDCCIPVHITIRESMPSPFHRRKMLGRETWCKVPFIPCRNARADSQWIGFRGFDSNLSLEPTEPTPFVWCSVDDPATRALGEVSFDSLRTSRCAGRN